MPGWRVCVLGVFIWFYCHDKDKPIFYLYLKKDLRQRSCTLSDIIIKLQWSSFLKIVSWTNRRAIMFPPMLLKCQQTVNEKQSLNAIQGFYFNLISSGSWAVPDFSFKFYIWKHEYIFLCPNVEEQYFHDHEPDVRYLLLDFPCRNVEGQRSSRNILKSFPNVQTWAFLFNNILPVKYGIPKQHFHWRFRILFVVFYLQQV